MSTSKKETTRNIVSLGLSNYVRPTLIEVPSKDWVLNGRDNSFYEYIIDRFNGSPTNAAIINSYIDLIYGKGLTVKNAAQNLEGFTKLKQVLSKTDLKRIISDFELFGEASIQVIQSKGKQLSSINHIAKNLVVPSIENEDGEIERYWFSRDWKDTREKPKDFPAFQGKEKIEIYVIHPYKAGKKYFSDPDYLAGLPYAEMEEEIANLNINSIKNGLSEGYIINVPDGVSLTAEQQQDFLRNVKRTQTGSSNASNFVISFNGRDEQSITIEPFPVNEQIHKQWEFLTGESRQQILTAHRATSPSIVGIISSSGFASTADEMDMAESQLLKRVIAPKQQFIIDALEDILVTYGINLDLEFIPLSEVAVEPQATELSSHCDPNCKDCKDKCKKQSMSIDELVNLGEAENLDDYYILDEIEVDYEEDMHLARVVSDNANAKSSQDSEDILIRYRYVGNIAPQRDFCMRMMAADKVYRKEDIIQAGSKAVNPGWGANGANTYSIWLYKGGGNCKHKWNRVIYVKKGIKIDVKSPLAETVSTTRARSKGYKVPVNDTLVSIAPTNMPNNGFLN